MLSIALPLLLTLAIAVLLIAYRSYGSLDLRRLTWFRSALLAASGVGVLYVLWMTIKGIRNPPQWDFLIFWINGQVAARGLNYYDAQLAAMVAQPFHVSADYAWEALNFPFLYPPPTILFFLALGWFSFQSAAVLWFTLEIVCLAASIYLVARTFLKDDSLRGVLLTGVLLFSIGGARVTLFTAQTLFLLLLMASLFFRDRDRFRGGLWLGVCLLLKPLGVMLLAYAVFRKKWRACVSALAVAILSTLATLAIFGPSVFRSYLKMGQTPLPAFMFTYLENQSLLGWMSRWFGYSKTTVDIFLPLAAILFVVTMWRVFRQPVASEATAFAMTLALALLIYPGALISYSTLLIVPIVLLVRRGLLLPVAATYVVTNLGGRHFIYTGIACALLWLVLIALRPKDPAESAQSSLTKRFGLIPDSAPAALS